MPTKVIELDLTPGPRDLVGLAGYESALVVCFLGGRPVGSVCVPTVDDRVTAHDLMVAIRRELGDVVPALQADNSLAERISQPARWHLGSDDPARRPTATVAVCTRDRPDDLAACLASLRQVGAREIIVVDNNSGDDRTRQVAQAANVRYVFEAHGGLDCARNRALVEATGEIVAFIDDDARATPGWLDAITRPFSDPEVACVVGPVMPAELETLAQDLFEAYRQPGLSVRFDRHVLDMTNRSPVDCGGIGMGANMALRRAALDGIGGFHPALDCGAETRAAGDTHMFYKVLAAGYRLVFESEALAWHRHRREMADLRRQMYNYGVSTLALWTLVAIEHRELRVIRALSWWLRHQPRQLWRALRGRADLPLDLVWAETRGMFYGPLAYLRARRALGIDQSLPARAVEIPELAPELSAMTGALSQGVRADFEGAAR